MGGLLVVLMMLVAVPVVLAARHYQRGLEGRSAVHFEGDKPDLAGYHWSWWWLPGWVCEFERDGRRWERRLWQRRNTPRSIAREPQRRASAVPDTLIGVLDQLGTFYSRQRVVLIWDGLSSHWSTKMRAYLDSQRAWLRAERLPAYAPELNPVECLWANLKDLELANLPTTTLAEVDLFLSSR